MDRGGNELSQIKGQNGHLSVDSEDLVSYGLCVQADA